MRLPILLLLSIGGLVAGGCGDSGTGDPPDAADSVASDDGERGTTPDDEDAIAGPGTPETFTYEVPLDPASPWPKFRRTARQTGASEVAPPAAGSITTEPWAFQTGKGIFSTPVVGGDGTVYVGSGDRRFYALDAAGTERWSFATGEIIDSSALLDDEGRLFVGSGDGHLYARDAADGSELWTWAAEDPTDTSALINWFEGNVAIGADGTLYVPNDNFRIYALDRTDGSMLWAFEVFDQTWSLPAVDVASGRLYVGNNNLLELFGDNIFAIGADGELSWSARVPGTVAASPLLTDDGLVLAGGFDGYLHAWDADDGTERWSFATRDHVYASAAQLPDGTIVQPSADGTIYGIDPADGSQRWAFDTLEPIRSSPAVDALGRVYVGSGEGTLFVLEPDGSLRWAMRLIEGDRNDLNASPALGRDAIYIAGESGEVFSVPMDWCRAAAAADDARCRLGPGEALPAEGATMLFTTRFGAPLTVPPTHIAPNQSLAFVLSVRSDSDTLLALIDTATLDVQVEPPILVDVQVSGDRRFLTIVPREDFAADEGTGKLTLSIAGDYLVNPDREALALTGGEHGGSFDTTLKFQLELPGTGALPLPLPGTPGDPAATWELHRVAAPLPTILPSYNQIGFDSLHYLVGLVEGTFDRGVGWVIGAHLDDDDATVSDPATRVLFPVTWTWTDGLLTLNNTAGFELEAMNAQIGFDEFRIAARIGAGGHATGPVDLYVTTVCGSIQLYGPFLQQLGFCHPDTDRLTAFGAALMRPHGTGSNTAPAGVGLTAFEITASGYRVDFDGSSLQANEHRFAILLVDPSDGAPVVIDYGLQTTQTANPDGTIDEVSLSADFTLVPNKVRAWLMIDTYPAAVQTLDLQR